MDLMNASVEPANVMRTFFLQFIESYAVSPIDISHQSNSKYYLSKIRHINFCCFGYGCFFYIIMHAYRSLSLHDPNTFYSISSAEKISLSMSKNKVLLRGVHICGRAHFHHP